MSGTVRFGHWGFDLHRAGDRYGPVVHADADLIWLVSGAVTLVTGAEAFPIAARGGASGLLLLPPGSSHVLEYHDDGPTRILYLHFSGLPPGAPPMRTWPRSVPLPEGDVVRPLLGHLAWLLERRDAGWLPQASAALGLVLLAACSGRCGRRSAEDAPLPPLLEAVAARVAAAWSGPRRGVVSLDDLATAAGVSREHLCRAAATTLGCGLAAALRLIRLQRAATQLTRFTGPAGDVAVVAAANGFPSLHHFTRAFTTVFGEPPVRFRERIRGGGAWPAVESPGVAALRRRIWELAPGK